MPGAGDEPQLDVTEEVVRPVGPCPREQRIVLRPQDRRRRSDPVLGRRLLLTDIRHDRPRACPVPSDRCDERPGSAVDVDEVAERFVVDAYDGPDQCDQKYAR